MMWILALAFAAALIFWPWRQDITVVKLERSAYTKMATVTYSPPLLHRMAGLRSRERVYVSEKQWISTHEWIDIRTGRELSCIGKLSHRIAGAEHREQLYRSLTA